MAGQNKCIRCGKPCGPQDTLCDECKAWFQQKTGNEQGQKHIKNSGEMPKRSIWQKKDSGGDVRSTNQNTGDTSDQRKQNEAAAQRTASASWGNTGQTMSQNTAGQNTVQNNGNGAAAQNMTPKFCPKCGKPLNPGAKFCPGCGAGIGNPAAQSNSADTGWTASNSADAGNTISDSAGNTASRSADTASGNAAQTNSNSTAHNTSGGTARTAGVSNTAQTGNSSSKKIIIGVAAAVIVVVVGIAGIKLIGGKKSKAAASDSYASMDNQSQDQSGDAQSSDIGQDPSQGDSNVDSNADAGLNDEDMTAENNSDSDVQAENEAKLQEAKQQAYDQEYAIHNYEIVVADVTWEEARQQSRDAGGYLVRINSAEEYSYIVGLLGEYTKIHFYLGGDRELNGVDYNWVGQNELLTEPALNSDDSWAKGYWYENEPSYQDTGVDPVVDEAYMNLICVSDTWYLNDSCDDLAGLYPDFLGGKVGYIIERE